MSKIRSTPAKRPAPSCFSSAGAGPRQGATCQAADRQAGGHVTTGARHARCARGGQGGRQGEEGGRGARRAARAAQDAYAKQLDAARKAQQERRVAAAAQVRVAEVAAEARPKPPRGRRVTFAPGVAPRSTPRQPTRVTSTPSACELQSLEMYACTRMPLPSIPTLATMATASVVCADAVYVASARGATARARGPRRTAGPPAG